MSLNDRSGVDFRHCQKTPLQVRANAGRAIAPSEKVRKVRDAVLGSACRECLKRAQYDRCYKSIARLLFYKLNVRRLDS